MRVSEKDIALDGKVAAKTQAALPLFFAFGFFGVMFGVWQALLPDLSARFELSSGELGLLISMGLLSSLPIMLIGGRLIDRVGQRVVVATSGLVIAAVFGLLSVVQSYALLVIAVLVFFISTGVYDLGINSTAISYEQNSGRRLLPYLHGSFSGGAALGAILVGLSAALNLPYGTMYLVLATALVLFVGIVWQARLLPSVAKSAERPRFDWRVYGNRKILLIAGIVAVGFLAEGAMETWSAIYLGSALGFGVIVGASGVAIFHLAMLTGRVFTGLATRFLSRTNWIRLAGLISAIGMTLALATDFAWVVLAGFLVVGLTLAGVAPIAFSLAGDQSRNNVGQVSSMLTTVGYSGFLVGPTLIGGLAEAFSLRVALLTVVAAGVIIFAASFVLAPAKRD